MPATAVHQIIGPEINNPKYCAAGFPPVVGLSALWQDLEAAALYRMPATKAEHSKGMVLSGMLRQPGTAAQRRRRRTSIVPSLSPVARTALSSRRRLPGNAFTAS